MLNWPNETDCLPSFSSEVLDCVPLRMICKYDGDPQTIPEVPASTQKCIFQTLCSTPKVLHEIYVQINITKIASLHSILCSSASYFARLK